MIHLVLGRIENQDTDIIVNSTNAEMAWEETTVNGDIHNAASLGFTVDCKAYIKQYGKLKTNDVVMMHGYRLKAKHILNVFPPFYEVSKTSDQNYDKIYECYKVCFDRLMMFDWKLSVTFPLLGAGTFMYPYRLSFGAFLTNAVEYIDRLGEIRMTFIDENVLKECTKLLKEVM
jgi:O-acetyl-ADP-ribose deacetylase (regulator of RNase III)